MIMSKPWSGQFRTKLAGITIIYEICLDEFSGIKFIKTYNILDPRLSIVSIFSFLQTDQNKAADR